MQAALRVRRMSDPGFAPAAPVPGLRASMGGAALAMGAFSNARYQIVGGVDRWLFDHSTYLLPYLAASTVFRGVSAWFGQETRLHLQARRWGWPLLLHAPAKHDAESTCHPICCMRGAGCGVDAMPGALAAPWSLPSGCRASSDLDAVRYLCQPFVSDGGS